MKSQRGNTLIELLIATFIVGMVLTGVAISLTYSIQREAISRYREGATSMAQEISNTLLERAQQGGGVLPMAIATGHTAMTQIGARGDTADDVSFSSTVCCCDYNRDADFLLQLK